MLAIRAIEHEEVAVARGLCEQLTKLPIDLAVEQDRFFDVVPIMRVVRRSLEIPGEFARIRVQRHNRARPKVVPFPALRSMNRIWIAYTPIQQVELGIVGATQP